MGTLKAAVATKDGISINLHFGHTTCFWVYEVDSENCKLIDKREVEHYCHGQHGDQNAMQKILHTIKDCDAVFIAMVGDGPKQKLENINVTPVSDYAHEAIEESLLNYVSTL